MSFESAVVQCVLPVNLQANPWDRGKFESGEAEIEKNGKMGEEGRELEIERGSEKEREREREREDVREISNLPWACNFSYWLGIVSNESYFIYDYSLPSSIRAAGGPIFIASPAGGTSIEEVAEVKKHVIMY